MFQEVPNKLKEKKKVGGGNFVVEPFHKKAHILSMACPLYGPNMWKGLLSFSYLFFA